jgi:putative ABC transport system permease protein
VVVNETFARRYLGSTPLGAKIPVAAYAPPDRPPPEATVVGVVADARYIGRDALSQPELYYCHCQFESRLPVQTVTLLVRVDGAPDAIAPALTVAAREADPQLVADVVMPLEQRLLATSLARPRLYAAVLFVLAGLALTIAGVGVFGLTSFWVSLRSRELAIRVTLGASRAGIVGLVLAQGVGVAFGGVVAGLAAAAGAVRLAGTQLYGVTTYDPATFIGVPIVLLSIAATASLLPAWRAATRDPLRTLRGA